MEIGLGLSIASLIVGVVGILFGIYNQEIRSILGLDNPENLLECKAEVIADSPPPIKEYKPLTPFQIFVIGPMIFLGIVNIGYTDEEWEAEVRAQEQIYIEEGSQETGKFIIGYANMVRKLYVVIRDSGKNFVIAVVKL